MSKDMWKDLFEIYQSVQSGEQLHDKSSKSVDPKVAKATQPRTMYIFAYLDDGDGKTIRDIPVKDRLSFLEARQAQLEQKIFDLESRVEELTDELEDD